MTEHICRKNNFIEKVATPGKPYQYQDSGLSNVFLVGIKYWICKVCGAMAAEIPAPMQLMNVIAKSVVMKHGLLTGEEVRFLRKRLGQKASEFAELIGKTPEHFSKIETGKLELTEPLDKLIRLTYGMLSHDKALLQTISADVQAWLKSIHKHNESLPIQIKKSGAQDWVQLPCAA
jgi:putative zinc finger/helix-turn-helix YgiT family protein